MWRPRNGERSCVETKDPETQGQRDVETLRNTGHGWDPAGGASRVLAVGGVLTHTGQRLNTGDIEEKVAAETATR